MAAQFWVLGSLCRVNAVLGQRQGVPPPGRPTLPPGRP